VAGAFSEYLSGMHAKLSVELSVEGGSRLAFISTQLNGNLAL
jgi:hypothetical protein